VISCMTMRSTWVRPVLFGTIGMIGSMLFRTAGPGRESTSFGLGETAKNLSLGDSALGRARDLGKSIPGACWERGIDRYPDDRLHLCQSAPLGGGRKRGEQKQAVGRSRGGRNTKIHALADAKGRLLAILLTGGEAHDCPVAARLIRRVKPSKRLLGDKGYDSGEFREELDARGTKPVIPNRCNRKQPFGFSKRLYKLRWRIENAFNRLKDFRRIATRYDRLARNYLASVCLAATLVWWI
jgi:transposase